MTQPKAEIKFLALDIDGVLTDGGMYYTEAGDQFKKFDTKDGRGIILAQKQGIKVGFLSSGVMSTIINNRAKTLDVKYVYVGLEEKLDHLQQWCKELGIDLKNVAYIGDDINDLRIMAAVGLTACPGDAVDQVKKVVNIVLQKKGGEGCVREFIDTFLLNS